MKLPKASCLVHERSCDGQNVTVWLHEIQSVSRTLRDYDYGTKVRLRSLIGEYGDFEILRSLNKNPKEESRSRYQEIICPRNKDAKMRDKEK